MRESGIGALPKFTGTAAWRASNLKDSDEAIISPRDKSTDLKNSSCGSVVENRLSGYEKRLAYHSPPKEPELKQGNILTGIKNSGKPRNSEACESGAKKHLDGNEKRLQAERTKWQQYKANTAIVKQALKNIDSRALPLNKRIVFSDDENSLSHNKKPITEPVSDQIKQLFSDDSEVEDETPLHVRDEFDGIQGQKLFALQSRFGNDPRFKMDKRFLDEEQHEIEVESYDDIVDSNISLAVKKKRKEEKEAEEEKKPLTPAPTPNESSNYFVVAENLHTLFSEENKKPKFSLFNHDNDLQTISRKGLIFEDTSTNAKQENAKKMEPIRTTSEGIGSTQEMNTNPFKPSGWFFLSPDDDKIKESCGYFYRYETDDAIRSKWEENRPSFIETFRKLRRDAKTSVKKCSNHSFKSKLNNRFPVKRRSNV